MSVSWLTLTFAIAIVAGFVGLFEHRTNRYYRVFDPANRRIASLQYLVKLPSQNEFWALTF